MVYFIHSMLELNMEKNINAKQNIFYIVWFQIYSSVQTYITLFFSKLIIIYCDNNQIVIS